MYLLDTNVVSETRKRRPHGAVLAWLKATPDGELRIPAVTIGELQRGAELTRKQDPSKAAEIDLWIEKILATFDVISMSGEHFREWARLMANHSWDQAEDAMIAAMARVAHATVVTRNVKDFQIFEVRVLNPFTYKGIEEL